MQYAMERYRDKLDQLHHKGGYELGQLLDKYEEVKYIIQTERTTAATDEYRKDSLIIDVFLWCVSQF